MKRFSFILISVIICQILGQDFDDQVIDNSIPLTFDHEQSDSVNGVVLIPSSSIKSINNTIVEYFSRERSIKGNKEFYRQIKRRLKQRFVDLGLNTFTQDFHTSPLHQQEYGDNATNIIGIWPGPNRGTDSDQILIIGAHYDSVKFGPGVEDNGSGSAAVLEIARAITEKKCIFDKTLIFVLFDLEEQGLKGSKHFVNDYLIPIEVNKNRAKVVGAFIMDMLLEYDDSPDSQLVAAFASVLPEFVSEVDKNGKRGDFIAVRARKGVDTPLFNKLEENWLNKDKYGLSLMAGLLPEFGSQLDEDTLNKNGIFRRSDHYSFWYPTPNITFAAIGVTDLGHSRRKYAPNYHRPTDDTRSLTEENLSFLKNTIDSIINTIFDLSDGMCFKSDLRK